MHLKLTVRLSPTESFDRHFDAKELFIGRSADSQLSFNGTGSEFVSARHARVHELADKVVIEDLASTNGTFVNLERISTAVALRAGDEIRLGQAGPRLHVAECWATAAAPRSLVAPPPTAAAPSSREAEKPAPSKSPQIGSKPWPIKPVGVAIALVGLLAIGIAVRELMPSPTSSPTGSVDETASRSEARLTAAIEPPKASSSLPVRPVTKSTASPQASPIVTATPSATATPPVASWHTIAGRAAPSVVLIGWENEGRRLPFCTGWAIGPKTVATMGFAVKMMEEIPPEKIKTFVTRSDNWNNVAYAESFAVHPHHHDTATSGDDAPHRNIGIIRLATPLPISTPAATDAECEAAMKDATECGLLTFPLRRSGVVAEDQITFQNRMNVVTVPIRIGSRDFAPSSIRWARHRLDSSDELFADLDITGGVVVNRDGKIVGIAYRPRGIAYVQPIAPLTELLAKEK